MNPFVEVCHVSRTRDLRLHNSFDAFPSSGCLCRVITFKKKFNKQTPLDCLQLSILLMSSELLRFLASEDWPSCNRNPKISADSDLTVSSCALPEVPMLSAWGVEEGVDRGG